MMPTWFAPAAVAVGAITLGLGLAYVATRPPKSIHEIANEERRKNPHLFPRRMKR